MKLTVKRIIRVKMLAVLLVKLSPILQINARNETSVPLEDELILDDQSALLGLTSQKA